MISVIPEIGHLALLLCLPIAIALTVLPMAGAAGRWHLLQRSGPLLSSGLWLFLAVAFACLTYSFLHDDFSVVLVAQHSNTALPSYYKFSAVWGNHEGSLLLWVFILASWTLAVAYLGKSLPSDMHARVLAVLGGIAVGFLLFIIFTSNPFERNLISPPLEGNDLNPLLQDIGLILHPPLLYIGYVGFAVAFAFAIAALIGGKLDAAWARWTRPWTTVAWLFLTVGIALGSWWAYYELGWGGWWFWDPVENASFMPWLAGTALIHSLAATEKRGVFRSWTVLLAILAFSLSLLGTFLVRSGILVSVHAFASDPTRGMFILLFLAVTVGGSLLLYALRAPTIKPLATFKLLSRESWLLINNSLLAVSLAVVLIGTLFPLVMSALDLGSYSVGPPYFNKLFLPLMVLLMLFMGVAPYLNWKHNRLTPVLVRPWYIVSIVALLLALLAVALLSQRYATQWRFGAFVTVALSSWLLLMTLTHAGLKARRFARAKKLSSRQGLLSLSRSYWGMVIAHSGIAVMALGIGLTSSYSVQKELAMSPGAVADVAGYRFVLEKLEDVKGPNYSATMATFGVGRLNEGALIKGLSIRLQPEKRFYYAAKNVMTEAGIHGRLTRDLYVSLGDSLEGEQWAVRIYVKPFIRCIWLGALMMAAGGLLVVIDKRYMTRQPVRTDSPSGTLASNEQVVV